MPGAPGRLADFGHGSPKAPTRPWEGKEMFFPPRSDFSSDACAYVYVGLCVCVFWCVYTVPLRVSVCVGVCSCVLACYYSEKHLGTCLKPARGCLCVCGCVGVFW